MVMRIRQRLSRELSEYKPLPEEFVRLSDDGLKKLEEKDRAYAEKMAKKRARVLAVKNFFSKPKEEKVEIAQDVQQPVVDKDKEIADDFINEDYARPNPWKKHGYERGHEDYEDL